MPPQHKARKQREEGVSGPSTEVPLATCKPGWRKQENAAEAWDTPYNERYKKIWEAFWAGETGLACCLPGIASRISYLGRRFTLTFASSVELPGLLRVSLLTC